MRPLLLFMVHFLLHFQSGLAQTGHGRVTYSLRFDDVELSEQELSVLPSEAVIVFNADRMRMNMSLGMGMQSAVIVQRDQVHVLMDVLGDKFAMRTTRDEIRKDSGGPGSLRLKQLSDEFKDIAGYRCRKAVFGEAGQDDVSVWFTDRLKTSATWYYQFDGLEGFPMEFDLNTTGMAVRMSAVSVQEDVPADELFTVGSEYRMLKQDEIKRMMGAGR